MATPEKKKPETPAQAKAETETVPSAISADAARVSMTSDALHLGLKPENAIYFYNRARDLFAENRFDEAQAAARCACECDTTMTLAWLLRGLALAQTFDYEDAKRCLWKATQLDPGSIVAWANYGEVCLKLYLYDEAQKALKTAIRLDPQALDPASRRARMLTLTRSLWGQG